MTTRDEDAAIVIFHPEVWDATAFTKLNERAAAFIARTQDRDSARVDLGLDAPLITWREVLERARKTRRTLQTRVHWFLPSSSDEAYSP
jgi:hypothetical protein